VQPAESRPGSDHSQVDAHFVSSKL
jgi:hypothetical protein